MTLEVPYRELPQLDGAEDRVPDRSGGDADRIDGGAAGR